MFAVKLNVCSGFPFNVIFRLRVSFPFYSGSLELGNSVTVEVMSIRRFRFLWKGDLPPWHPEAEKGAPG